MQTYDGSAPETPRLPGRTTNGTPQSPNGYVNTQPGVPRVDSPGLPDYGAASTRVQGLETKPYTSADLRRIGSMAQGRGNAVARQQSAQFLARGGSMGGGAAALLGGSLYGAAAMGGLDAERGADLENRKAGIEGEFRKSDALTQIDALRQQAALAATALDQRAVESNRNFDYSVYADDRDMDLRERQQTRTETQQQIEFERGNWRFNNERNQYAFSPANPFNPNSPLNPRNPINDPYAQYRNQPVNNSSNASWNARNNSTSSWMY